MRVAKPETKLRPIRVDLDAEGHAALRVLAAKAGMPMSQYVRALIEKDIEKNRNKS